MSQPNNQSIIGKALLKGTLMALTNACIIWLILYIANMDKSVLMVVAVVVCGSLRIRDCLLRGARRPERSRSSGTARPRRDVKQLVLTA